MENINITIDELTLMIKNILENKTLNIDDNFILKDIIKEQQELKNINKILKDELDEKKLQISSLEECIIPNDDAINELNKKFYELRNKYNNLKIYSDKLTKINDKMFLEKNKYFELYNKRIETEYKQNELYNNEKQELINKIEKLKKNIKNIDIEYNKLKENNEKIQFDKNNNYEQINLIDEIKNENKNLYEENLKQFNDIQKFKLNISELNDKMYYVDEENKKILETNKLQDITIIELQNNIIQLNEKIKVLSEKQINNDKNKNNNKILVGGNNNDEIKLNADNIHLFDIHNTRKNITLKNKLFFEDEMKKHEIKNNNDINSTKSINTNDINNTNNTNNTNITFSTDYMVSYLKNDTKLKPKEERIDMMNIIKEDDEEIEDNEEENIYNNYNINIFQKNNLSSTLTKSNIPENKKNSSITDNYIDITDNYIDITDNYIDISKINNIVVNSDNSKKTSEKINELTHFINNEKINEIENIPVNIKKTNNNIVGGNTKNKMTIHIIDNIKKIYIGEELTTLTEQEINIDDKKKIHLTYNKKFKRYKKKQDVNKISL